MYASAYAKAVNGGLIFHEIMITLGLDSLH